jgi:hypothetical protein
MYDIFIRVDTDEHLGKTDSHPRDLPDTSTTTNT